MEASELGQSWEGGGLYHKDVKYYTGPSPPNLVLNLNNEQEYVITPLWNAIGIINGTISDEIIVIGNHRDAWIAGGAVDPNSGSTALNEIIRSFGAALQQGWKPMRTIVFASWDGEEYGLIGSTEWVEEYLPWLSKSAIAYLNIDVATEGPVYTTHASPILNKALYEATSLVSSPNQTIPGQTVRDVWDGKIGVMGSGSDFTAFQDFAGIPSMDMAFTRSDTDPVYHYHSNYDSFAWMNNFGDPSYEYHTTISKIVGLLALSIAETPLLNMNATDYATALFGYLDSVKASAMNSSTDPTIQKTTFRTIKHSIKQLHRAAVHLDKQATYLSTVLREGIPRWKWWQRWAVYKQIRNVNQKYIYLERQFLHSEGLDSRPWFKHVIFAPGLWTGYSGATFPGLVEAVDDGDERGMEVSISDSFLLLFFLSVCCFSSLNFTTCFVGYPRPSLPASEHLCAQHKSFHAPLPHPSANPLQSPPIPAYSPSVPSFCK